MKNTCDKCGQDYEDEYAECPECDNGVFLGGEETVKMDSNKREQTFICIDDIQRVLGDPALIAFNLAVAEREHQNNKWGKTEHDDFVWNAILGEEVGEVANVLLNPSDSKLKFELVQVAAVAIAWLEQIIEYEGKQNDASK